MKKKRFTKKRIKALLHKVIPFILVGVITSSAVMMSYEKASEVKAVAVVDDVVLMVALLALAGITYTSVNEYWTHGQWLEDDDSPVLDPELKEWADGFSERWEKQWDEDVREQAIEDGLIDPETGEYIGNAATGGGGDGDPDNDDDKDPDKNKFPTWANLKETVAKCGGRVDLAFASMALPYIVGALGHSILKSAGLMDYEYILPDGMNVPLDDITSSTAAIIHSDDAYLDTGTCRATDCVMYTEHPICFVRYDDSFSLLYWSAVGASDFDIGYGTRFYRDGNFISEFDRLAFYGSIKSIYNNTKFQIFRLTLNGKSFSSLKYMSKYPTFNTLDDAKNYMLDTMENGEKKGDEYVNPDTIGQTSALKDMLEETNGKLDKGLHNMAILPTTEQLNKYFEDLKNALNEEEKQEVMDEFVRSITDPVTDPNPDPNPNPNPDPDPDNSGDNTGDDTPKNELFLADLKHLFPFCIPFDLVDCFRLFNAEPVTPRVEVPVHFGIINYDHTFVFDLSDFNGVAVVCRSMFLILYMVGLILATRALIKG